MESYEKGLIKGKSVILKHKGKKAEVVLIDMNDYKTMHNLQVMRNRNAKFYFIEDLARKLNIEIGYLERAVIEGKLDVINEHLRSDYRDTADAGKIGIDIQNPKNKEFLKDKFEEARQREIALEEERRREIEASLMAPKTASELRMQRLEGDGISLLGLRSAIAWHLAPNTRQVLSDIAKQDGYAGKVISKKIKIKMNRKFGLQDGSKDQELTKAEEIKLRQYYKTAWEEAGIQEFSEACKKAQEIVDLYLEQGLNAIKDPDIRRVILRYIHSSHMF